MRRFVNAFLMIGLGLLLITAVVAAQTNPPGEDGDGEGLTIVPAPDLLIKGTFEPIDMEPATDQEVALFLASIPASDSCALAAQLSLPGGVAATVNSNTTEDTDPVLSCTWGKPDDPRGFRTAWYRFNSPISGRVTIRTLGSNYDTILAVFSDDGAGCGNLVELACDDDTEGFTSEVTLNIKRNVTYYVEVADYHFGAPDVATLNLSLLFDTVSRWEIADILPVGGLSRHASVVDGEDFYLIGGQYVDDQTGAPIISREVYRYDLATQTWQTLAQKPGPGYSNTDAALLNGRIYLPSGFNGNQETFDGRHWIYEIASNSWREGASIGDDVGWPDGQPLAWGQAVASRVDNRYFFIGGVGSQPAIAANSAVSDRVYEYLPAIDSWSERSQRMLSPRFAHTAAWIINQVCVAGGLSSNEAGAILLGSAECFNPLQGSWFVIPDMIYPRYGAGSAVGPDRKWYVFGGIDASGAVPPVEVYDPFTNRWAELDIVYELGVDQSLPTPAFATGAFWEDELWVFGGEDFASGDALPTVATVRIEMGDVFLPIVANRFTPANDTLATAAPIGLGQRVPSNFSSADDRFDVFRFLVPTTRRVTVEVTDVPTNRDYDLRVYDQSKLLWVEADTLPGNVAQVTQTLPAGLYYAVVERKEPAAPNPARLYYIRAYSTP